MGGEETGLSIYVNKTVESKIEQNKRGQNESTSKPVKEM